MLQHLRHILGQRSGDSQRFVCAWMCERELRGVEGVTCDECGAAAVEIIAEQGMTNVREVDADLMGASRLKAQPQERVLAVRPHCFVMRSRRLAVEGDMAQDDARQGARNGGIDRALCG